MKKSRLLGAVCACILGFISSLSHAITLHTSDFINDATRANFNGFESIPNDGDQYTGGSGPYIEDGISVEQIDGDGGNDIWVTFSAATHEGSYSWYPVGGDSGYTMITMADGSDFTNIGFYAGTGAAGVSSIIFDLLLDGASVYSGSTPFTGVNNNIPMYIGFSGGGFDSVLVRDNCSGSTMYDGGCNALTLDAIETSSAVPIPTAFWLFGSGLLGLTGIARRKKVA